MLSEKKSTCFICPSFKVTLIIFLIILLFTIIQTIILRSKTNDPFNFNIPNRITKYISSIKSLQKKMNQIVIQPKTTLETTIQCIGSLYNQSCLFKNLYYFRSTFIVLTVKGNYLPPFFVRTDAYILQHITPDKREFDSYVDLETFVRTVIYPKRIPSVTLHFSQPWLFQIGHSLFDGLYPGYLALIRFPPRHLLPFRILIELADCPKCWSEEIYSRFAGLGVLRHDLLNKMSTKRWFVFDELVMGSGTLCQRCIQPNLQLPGGVELDGSRLFRDRMYQQLGLIPPIVREKSSSEGRTSNDILRAFVIHNKRFRKNDRKEIYDAIDEINNYTKTIDKTKKFEWPLINISYVYYDQIHGENISLIQINDTSFDMKSPFYELIDSSFIAQLKLVQQMDIHVTGPGTGQLYQTFLSDGSVTINLGGIRPWAAEDTNEAYPSYVEQYVTSGTPYIKGLYYPINERTKGIKKDEVVKLIRQAAQLILQGFPLPVNPRENLAADGQLFVEMCQKDKDFCSLVTTRSHKTEFACLDFWAEDFVHEYNHWKLGGYTFKDRNISCPYNHTLLHELRDKYGIKHRSYH